MISLSNYRRCWGERYEQSLLNKLNNFRQVSNSKLIMVVTTLPAAATMAAAIEQYNQADVLIVPSVAAGTRLLAQGLQVSRLGYLNVWDHELELSLPTPSFKRQLVTLDPALAEQVPAQVVAPGPTAVYDLNGAGGFGLIWPATKDESDLTAAAVLASGLPVIVQQDSYLAELIARAGMGVAVADLAAATAYLRQAAAADYQVMAQRAGRFSALVRAGGFTSQTISQALADVSQLK